MNGGANGYPAKAMALFGQYLPTRNFATSGAGIATLSGRAATVDAAYSAGRVSNVLFVLIGANNLASGDPAAFVASLKTYCQARQAVGWKVVLATVLPQTISGFNTNRNTANALIVADPTFYDGLARFDLDATMGCDACASNLTYYSDGKHPTAAGQALLALIANAAIYAVLML